MLITLAGFSLSDVHHTFDFLAPIIGVLQFVFILGFFTGKLWGLIGYTISVIGLIVATFAYYMPKNKIDVAMRTSIVFVPLIILAIYSWTYKRSYFRYIWYSIIEQVRSLFLTYTYNRSDAL